MASFSAKDFSGTQTYFLVSSGTGVVGDPYIQTLSLSASSAVIGAVTQSGTWNITNISGTVSLPTGASTAANQATIIASASSIDGKITACNTGAVVLSSGTVTTVTTLTGSGIAHDGVDSGNPHKIGARATASVLGGTPVAAADRTDLLAGLDGIVFVRPYGSDEDTLNEQKVITDGSSTACTSALAATASQRIYVTDISLTNSSSTNVYVDIRDGAAGSILDTLSVPANGGNNKMYPKPLRFTANTAVAFDPSAAATSIHCTARGYKSKQ